MYNVKIISRVVFLTNMSTRTAKCLAPYRNDFASIKLNLFEFTRAESSCTGHFALSLPCFA